MKTQIQNLANSEVGDKKATAKMRLLPSVTASHQETLSGRNILRLKFPFSSFSFCLPQMVRRYFSTPRIFPVLSEDSVASFFPITDWISRSSSLPLASVLRFSLLFSVLSSGSLSLDPSLRLSDRLFLREMALLDCCLPLRLSRRMRSRCQWVRSISRLVTLRLLSSESTLWESARPGGSWF